LFRRRNNLSLSNVEKHIANSAHGASEFERQGAAGSVAGVTQTSPEKFQPAKKDPAKAGSLRGTKPVDDLENLQLNL
jgi:hypothetical protein